MYPSLLLTTRVRTLRTIKNQMLLKGFRDYNLKRMPCHWRNYSAKRLPAKPASRTYKGSRDIIAHSVPVRRLGANSFNKEFFGYNGYLSKILRKPRPLLPRIGGLLGKSSNIKVGMSLSESFGHGSFLTLALSFSFQDILSLRLCGLLSGIAMAIFNFYHPNGKPLFLPFWWNLLFIFVNTYMIILIGFNQWKSKQLGIFEQKMFEQNFALTGMDLVDFRKICLSGELTKVKKGEFLTKQGTRSNYVRVIISGNATYSVDGQPVSSANPGNFISELGLHAGIRFAHQVSTASTIATSDELVCYSWRRGALIDVLEGNQRIGAMFQMAISNDLVRKLSSDGVERNKMSHRDFRMVVKMVVQEKNPDPHRVNMLDRYRKIHNISDEELDNTLRDLGWTMEQFYAGSNDEGDAKRLANKAQYQTKNELSDLSTEQILIPLGVYE